MPLLQCVIQSLLGQDCVHIEIVVAEHSPHPLCKGALPDGIKHCHVPSPEMGFQFNKSQAMNVGVRVASAPIVVLHDADIVVPAGYLQSVVAHLNSGWDAVRPLRFLFQLNSEQSQRLIREGAGFVPSEVQFIMQNFPGLSSAIRRDVYDRLGGHDEDFKGWGGEDLEFLDRLQTVRLFRGGYIPAIHLWHETAPKKASGDRNSKLLEEKRKIPPEERIRILRQKWKTEVGNQKSEAREAGP